ncbi:MAG: hypothetical protein LBH17_06695 [Oscillospiraceae bacterium]|jgi:vacuolar-type H+-ATPase subunit H|nr:hypothetical protein [Oscillospiraceae bacterium]
MSQNAIKSIAEAEEAAKTARAETQSETKRALEAAEQDGKASVAAALAQAEGEIRHMRREFDAKAEEYAKELVTTTGNKRAALRAHAEARIGEAAGKIVERIVSG